ncbi:MAG TPA: hypothetical protein DCG39_12230 [Opitutae bacterium]|nr:hypothetical protein [Opitutae bacterium]
MRFILFALLASCLSLGLQAETLFEQKLKLAKAGDATAQKVVGEMYSTGSEGAPKNLKMAAYWMGQAAKQGIPAAQHNLAVMYNTGEGVAKSDKAAVYWYRKAAAQGAAKSQFYLGVIYQLGIAGVSKNPYEAFKWYRKAAEQGDAEAQLSLGAMYAKGEGVIEDYVAAYAWTIVAKANGFDAEHNLQIFKKKMTPEQIAKAQNLAKVIYKRTEANKKD